MFRPELAGLAHSLILNLAIVLIVVLIVIPNFHNECPPYLQRGKLNL